MTKLDGDGDPSLRRCRWCHRPLAIQEGPGRPREYCRHGCRQRDYEARKRAAERGLDEGEIIVTRARLHDLQDRLWVLACAVEDVDGDLARAALGSSGGEADGEEYRAAVAWLLDAARPLIGTLDLAPPERP